MPPAFEEVKGVAVSAVAKINKSPPVIKDNYSMLTDGFNGALTLPLENPLGVTK